jgi:hypothetical protein
MSVYRPARQYLPAAAVALGLAIFSAWIGWNWLPAFIPAILLVLSSAFLAFLASRPPIIIRENSWSVGEQSFLWSEVESLDTTGWTTPMVLRIGLRGGRPFYLIYPGEPDRAGRLLRQMRRLARGARIEGIPYRQYWGEVANPAVDEAAPAPRYRVLRPEDEAEVERMYQRLKTAGRLDAQPSEERRD